MSISDKLVYLNETKNLIKTAIENKGVTVGSVPFRDYKDKIAAIPAVNQRVMPSPVGGGIDYLQYGTGKVSLFWRNSSDTLITKQKVVYKKNAIPAFPIVDTVVEVDNEINTLDLNGLDADSTYGVWIVTVDADGVMQTSRSDGNTGYFKTQTTEGSIIEVTFPVGWSSRTIYVLRSDIGDVFASTNDSNDTGIWKLNMVTLEWDKVYQNGYSINVLVMTHDNKVMMSTTTSPSNCNGLYFWNGNEIQHYNSAIGAFNYSSVVFLGGKTYIVSYVTSSVYIWDGVTMSHYVPPSTISSLFVLQGELFGVSLSTGLYKWNGSAFALVSNAFKSTPAKTFTASSGISFICGSSNTSAIYMWNGTTLTQVYSVAGVWQFFYECIDGSIWCGTSSNGLGLLKWNGTAFVVSTANVQIQAYGGFFRHSSGEYVFCESVGKLMKYNGTTFVSLGLSYVMSRPYVDSNGVLWIVDMGVSPAGIYYLSGSDFVRQSNTNISSNALASFNLEDDTYLWMTTYSLSTSTVKQTRIHKATKVIETLSSYLCGLQFVSGSYLNSGLIQSYLVPNGVVATSKTYSTAPTYSLNYLYAAAISSDKTKVLINK